MPVGQARRHLRTRPHSAPALRNVAYWRGRTLRSPRGGLRGTVISVHLCDHRHLCDGVQLVVLWRDGLETLHCSADVAGDRLAR